MIQSLVVGVVVDPLSIEAAQRLGDADTSIGLILWWRIDIAMPVVPCPVENRSGPFRRIDFALLTRPPMQVSLAATVIRERRLRGPARAASVYQSQPKMPQTALTCRPHWDNARKSGSGMPKSLYRMRSLGSLNSRTPSSSWKSILSCVVVGVVDRKQIS